MFGVDSCSNDCNCNYCMIEGQLVKYINLQDVPALPTVSIEKVGSVVRGGSHFGSKDFTSASHLQISI